jgi:hypothetical protein
LLADALARVVSGNFSRYIKKCNYGFEHFQTTNVFF